MPDSIRQQLIDAWVARLGLIAPGYEFTLPDGIHECTTQLVDAPDGSPGVYPWRKTDFAKTQVPAIALFDTESETTPGPSTQHEHQLDMELEGHVLGKTSADAARAFLADIKAAIGSDPRWKTAGKPNGLARWTDITLETIDVQQVGDVIAAVRIKCAVTYRTPLWRM